MPYNVRIESFKLIIFCEKDADNIDSLIRQVDGIMNILNADLQLNLGLGIFLQEMPHTYCQ